MYLIANQNKKFGITHNAFICKINAMSLFCPVQIQVPGIPCF